MVKVYLITNKLNNLKYIGVTKNLSDRLNKGHRFAKSKLGNSIKKYGWDNFTTEIIAEVDSYEEAWALECRFIAEFKTKYPDGYNMTDGGEGATNPTQETRDKISKANTGHSHHPWKGKKMPHLSGPSHRWFGKNNAAIYRTGLKATPETLVKLSNSIKAAYARMTPEQRSAPYQNPETKERKRKACSWKKAIVCINNSTVYRSRAEAALILSVYAQNIRLVLRGKAKTTKGLRFRYASEYEIQKLGDKAFVEIT